MRIRSFFRKALYRHGRMSKKRRILLFFIILLIFLLLLSGIVLMRLGPMVVELALANATDVITLTVNKVISEKVVDGTVKYDDLVSLQTDSNGNITALITNMANVNVLQAEITNAIVERFSDSDITSVRIPVGTLLGGAILSGRGPSITVDILSVTNVSTNFRNEFTSAGINQTRHTIMMDVNVSLGILLAGYSGNWDNVLTEITVAETVIVGSVPNTYASIE